MMSTAATKTRIELTELVDYYVEQPCSSCANARSTTWPSLYSIEVDGELWLSDRYWLLPKRVCVVHDEFTVEELPAKNLPTVRAWIDALRDNELGPAEGKFAPHFAGPLTLAGLTAFTCGFGEGSNQPHALATDTERVGVIMPIRDGARFNTTSIPMPVAAVAMYKQIAEAEVYDTEALTIAASWHLALQLSQAVAS